MRTLGRALVVACLASALGVPAARATTLPTPPPCQDVVFIGARGSGQPATGSDADAGTGFGPEVYQVYRRLVLDLPGLRVTGIPVDFPARGVEVLAQDLVTGAGGAYFNGLDQGVADVTQKLRLRASSCPSERIVLAGFSQGAMVMHRVLQNLSADDSAAGIVDRVDGAILIADGDRMRKDRFVELGTASTGRGIGQVFRASSGSVPTPLSAKLTRRTVSVCQRMDLVCDASTVLGSSNLIGDALNGIRIHSEGYRESSAVRAATDVVARRVIRNSRSAPVTIAR